MIDSYTLDRVLQVKVFLANSKVYVKVYSKASLLGTKHTESASRQVTTAAARQIIMDYDLQGDDG